MSPQLTTWTKPPEWQHVPGEPTRPPIVPSWVGDVVRGGKMPLIPLPGYQQEWLRNPARFKLHLATRQCGKDWGDMLAQVVAANRAEEEGSRYRAIVLSASKDAAREDIIYATQHARALKVYQEAKLREQLDTYTDDDGSKTEYSKFSVEFPKGSLIEAIAANPKTAVGRSANVAGSEVSRWQDAEAVWDAVFPFVTRRKLRIALYSTPYGTGNLWHDLCTRHTEYGFDIQRTNIWDAIQDIESLAPAFHAAADRDPASAESIHKYFEMLRIDPDPLYRGCRTDDVWAQNYMLSFLDILLTYLSLAMITSCEESGIEWPSLDNYVLKPNAGALLFAGWDVARKHDLSVIWIAEDTGGKLVTRYREEMQGVPLPSQFDRLEEIMAIPGMKRVEIDETGMGLAVKEFAERRWGSARVGGVTFTQPSRLELAKHFRAGFEDRTWVQPPDDKIRNDFRLVKSDGDMKNERIMVDESDPNADSHADRFWAAALCRKARNTYFEDGAMPPENPPSANPSSLGRGSVFSLARKLLGRVA